MRFLPQSVEDGGIRRHSDDRRVAKYHFSACRTWPTAQCRDRLGAGPAGAGAIAVVVLGWCCVSGFLVCMYLGSKQHQKRKIVFALEKETPTSRINRAISPKVPKKLK